VTSALSSDANRRATTTASGIRAAASRADNEGDREEGPGRKLQSLRQLAQAVGGRMRGSQRDACTVQPSLSGVSAMHCSGSRLLEGEHQASPSAVCAHLHKTDFAHLHRYHRPLRSTGAEQAN
jgi:hypothetical protein